MAGYVNPQFNNLMKNDPRYGLAQTLLSSGLEQQSGQAGALGALAQALTAGVGAWGTKKLSDEYQGRQQGAATDLATALGQINGREAETQQYGNGQSINWDSVQPDMGAGIRTLSQNPDLADVATTLQMKQIESKNSLANKQAEMELAQTLAQKKPISPYEQAQLNYKDRELTTDAYGNTIQKYAPQGGAPAMTMGGSVPASGGQTGLDLVAGARQANPAANSPQVLIARAKEQDKQNVEQEAQKKVNLSGANEFLAKSQDLRSLLQAKNPDGSFAYDDKGEPIPLGGVDDVFGKIQGSGFGQGVQNITNPTAAALRDQIENQLSNLELSVAQMKLKGQGQITESERAIARRTLPQLNNVDARTALKNLDQTEQEAKRLLSKNQPANPEIQAKRQAALAAGYSEAEIDAFLNGQ